MFWSKTLGRGKAMVAAAACAWRCPCWDCRAQRRHLSAGRPVAAMAETVFAYAAPQEAP